MPDFGPFRGIRFDKSRVDPAAGICPPYDVIDEAGHQRLLDHHQKNAVRWVLGKDPQNPKGDIDEYRRRGDEFRSWNESGDLAEDTEPSIYVYELQYTDHHGNDLAWRGFLGALEAAPWGARGVFPHEEVHANVVTDRLALLQASGVDTGVVQISVDGRDGFQALFDAAMGNADVLFEGKDFDGQLHKLARIADTGMIGEIHGYLDGRDAVIADGHHRYTTLIQHGQSQDRVARVLAAVGDLFQDGLRIHPTHRLIRWEGNEEAPDVAHRLAEALHSEGGPEALRFETPAGKNVDIRTIDDADGDTLARRLVVALDSIIAEPRIENFHDDEAARQRLASVGDRALLCWMPPVSKDEFWRRASGGEVFPPKTTYFLPKISTGLVAKWLDD